jgi:AcrR family transcriptional regulator
MAEASGSHQVVTADGASGPEGRPVHAAKSTSWLGKVFEFNPAALNWPHAVLFLDVALVPLVIFWAIGREEYLLSALFGVLFTMLADPGGSYGHRASHTAVFGLIGAGVTALGFGIGGDAWGWLVLAAGAVTLLAGLTITFGVHRFVAAYLLNIWFIVALAVAAGFHHTAQNASYTLAAHITSYTWAQVLAWAGGSALWIAVTFVAWLIRGRQDRPQPWAELPGDTARRKLTGPLIMFAVLRAIVVAGTVALAFGLNLPHGYWMVIAAMIAMKASLDQSTIAAVQRLVGALIGAVAAALLLLIPARTAEWPSAAGSGSPGAGQPSVRSATAATTSQGAGRIVSSSLEETIQLVKSLSTCLSTAGPDASGPRVDQRDRARFTGLAIPVDSRRWEKPMPPSPPGSRVQRRVARTKAAIEDAFVQLVLERGYERVAVEDITDRADLARATFYAHYPNKEAVQFSVFNRLTDDLVQRLAGQGGPPGAVHRDVIQAAYKHAAEMPDLYRACLSDARTRQAHLSTLSRYAEQNFRDRLTALGRQPRVPVPVMARAFVGAHVAVLEAWLAGELDDEAEELASMALDLLIYGTAWAHGVRLDELGYSPGLPADARPPALPADNRIDDHQERLGGPQRRRIPPGPPGRGRREQCRGPLQDRHRCAVVAETDCQDAHLSTSAKRRTGRRGPRSAGRDRPRGGVPGGCRTRRPGRGRAPQSGPLGRARLVHG